VLLADRHLGVGDRLRPVLLLGEEKQVLLNRFDDELLRRRELIMRTLEEEMLERLDDTYSVRPPRAAPYWSMRSAQRVASSNH
jgi:hypothetical protein